MQWESARDGVWRPASGRGGVDGEPLSESDCLWAGRSSQRRGPWLGWGGGGRGVVVGPRQRRPPQEKGGARRGRVKRVTRLRAAAARIVNRAEALCPAGAGS